MVMGRRALLLLALLGIAAPGGALAAGCATGDAKCFCDKAGGTWRSELAKGDMPVACTFHVMHQGRDRSYNVYLPANYDGKKTQPVWMHLHGVYTSEWGGDLKGQYPGEAILCRDACALWDGMAGDKREGLNPKRADNAIVVYPETAIGDPYKRSFWSVPWWRCSMGDCVPSDVDDVGFLERVAQDVQAKHSGAGKLFLSGNSSGGMMTYRLLCESEWFARHLTAASIFSGGMGRDYQCAGRGSKAMATVPLLITHGTQDEVIGYQYASVVDGSPFQAVVDTARSMVDRRGCPAAGSELPGPFFAAQKIECRDYCGGFAGDPAAGGRNAAAVDDASDVASPAAANAASNAPAPAAANAAPSTARNNNGAANAPAPAAAEKDAPPPPPPTLNNESSKKRTSSSSSSKSSRSSRSSGSRSLLQRGIGEAAANAAANAVYAAGRNGAGLAVKADPWAVNAPGARSSRGEVMKDAPEPPTGPPAAPPPGGRNGDGGAPAPAGARDAGAPPALVRFCSVPGRKHNLYEVVRSFPIDVTAAWFAKHAGAAWGPTPPS